MELILEQGSYYANMLYAFRSVSRAIPAMKEDDPTRKKVFNIKTFEVLSPEMDKLKELLTFTTSASTFFTSILTRLCTLDSGTSRDLFCGLLIAVLDVLQKIDNLKDMKACLQNDFAGTCATLVHTLFTCVCGTPSLWLTYMHSRGSLQARVPPRAERHPGG